MYIAEEILGRKLRRNLFHTYGFYYPNADVLEIRCEYGKFTRGKFFALNDSNNHLYEVPLFLLPLNEFSMMRNGNLPVNVHNGVSRTRHSTPTRQLNLF